MACSARRGGAGPREHGPGLGDGVDPALLVLLGAERSAVVEVGAAIPLAIPGQLEHVREPVASAR